jgi:CHAD domain-containing protein/CYTH domain-containing protein
MDGLEATLLDEPAPRGARVVALALLGQLATERKRLSVGHDEEALHDFRVALRRLRSWLGGMRATLRGSLPRGARRRLRRLAKSSNAGRDAEVFVTWLTAASPQVPAGKRSAARWLLARFELQKHEAGASLDSLLERDFPRAHERLIVRLEEYWLAAHVHGGLQEPTLAGVMASLLREHGTELTERLDEVRSPDSERAAHRARIAGKHLRYLLEPLALHIEGGERLVEQLKLLQDSLGDLHDAHIWLMMLRDMAAEAAMGEGRRLARGAVGASAGTATGTGGAGADVYPALAGFALLVRLAQQRAADAYEQFAQKWGKRGARRFFRDLDATCVSLEARASMGTEIERKFLLTRLPREMPESVSSRIEQGYLPGRRLVERLRSEGRNGRTRYFRTVKWGQGMVRGELEEETSRELFDALWPLTVGKRLTKTRHYVRDGTLTWEIDDFPDRALVVAELELPAASAVVTFPPWLAPYVDREVTGEPAFVNVNLAR